ncbi:hypothetical protein EB809_20595 [Marinobacter sp. R17]|nr:hypothetical protein EB809_20595 [Marinobacter sp. R17]
MLIIFPGHILGKGTFIPTDWERGIRTVIKKNLDAIDSAFTSFIGKVKRRIAVSRFEIHIGIGIFQNVLETFRVNVPQCAGKHGELIKVHQAVKIRIFLDHNLNPDFSQGIKESG